MKLRVHDHILRSVERIDRTALHLAVVDTDGGESRIRYQDPKGVYFVGGPLSIGSIICSTGQVIVADRLSELTDADTAEFLVNCNVSWLQVYEALLGSSFFICGSGSPVINMEKTGFCYDRGGSWPQL